MPGERARFPKFAVVKVTKKGGKEANVKILAAGTKARVTEKRREYLKTHPSEKKDVRCVRIPLFRKVR